MTKTLLYMSVNNSNKNEKQMSALLFWGTLVSHYLNKYNFDRECIVVGQVQRGETD